MPERHVAHPAMCYIIRSVCSSYSRVCVADQFLAHVLMYRCLHVWGHVDWMLTSVCQGIICILVCLQDILKTQMGMSLPEMKAFCQADPVAKAGQSLPGAHLPSKGFWLTKRPTAPSTAAAPSGRAGRLMHKLSFNTQSSTSTLQSTSDGF